jgi:hypothetical protein
VRGSVSDHSGPQLARSRPESLVTHHALDGPSDRRWLGVRAQAYPGPGMNDAGSDIELVAPHR